MIYEEENLQVACVRWFSYQYQKLAILLHHSPNGGRRTASEGRRFKEMGTRAGFPDLVLHYPNAQYHGLFIELKSRKGVQRESQKYMQSALEQAGYRYEIIRTFDEFVDCIRGYLATSACSA